jgi:hypothetical protein
MMRTTLTIDDDVLTASRDLAQREHKSLGEVISALARQALRPTPALGGTRNGIALLPARADATSVTSELVRQLRDETP